MMWYFLSTISFSKCFTFSFCQSFQITHSFWDQLGINMLPTRSILDSVKINWATGFISENEWSNSMNYKVKNLKLNKCLTSLQNNKSISKTTFYTLTQCWNSHANNNNNNNSNSNNNNNNTHKYTSLFKLQHIWHDVRSVTGQKKQTKHINKQTNTKNSTHRNLTMVFCFLLKHCQVTALALTYAYPFSITFWMKVTTSGTYCVMRVRQSQGRTWKEGDSGNLDLLSSLWSFSKSRVVKACSEEQSSEGVMTEAE